MTLVPVPDGPIRQIATENTYCSAPYAARTQAGTALLAYRTGLGHVATLPQLRLRRQPAGCDWWTQPAVVANCAPGGLAVELGGTRIWLGLAEADRTGPSTATNYRTKVVWSDDDGITWSSPVQIPAVVAGQTIAGSLLWHDDLVYAATYGAPTSGTYDVCRVHTSADRGVTWTLRATISVANRHATEPALVVLADGRVAMLIRVPSAGGYDYIYSTATANPASWPTPQPAIYFGSGLPNAKRLPDNRLVVVHRGQSDASPPPVYAQPIAVSLLDENAGLIPDPLGSGLAGIGYQLLDLACTGDHRWPMYGDWLPGVDGSPDRLIWAAQHTREANALLNPDITAGLYERDVKWRESPAYDTAPV